ncbi:hypothetical protein [Mycobacterium sp. SMC-14]|uniref:hypothetical protein n=1 Tax=Mycobacterium sp. SMC-14 TaxID=3385968 RepID=UPI00390C4992
MTACGAHGVGDRRRTVPASALRAFAITLTERARSVLPDLDRAGRELEDSIAEPLSSAERNTLRDLLQRIAAGADLIPGVHPDFAEGAADSC